MKAGRQFYHCSTAIISRRLKLVFVFVLSFGSFAAQAKLDKTSLSSCDTPEGAIFKDGVLPDTKTAELVATQILTRIYGTKLISPQLPLSVMPKGDRYVINGILRSGSIGGHATIVLCKSNAAVLFLSHSK